MDSSLLGCQFWQAADAVVLVHQKTVIIVKKLVYQLAFIAPLSGAL
jgi:hypothetical protein